MGIKAIFDKAFGVINGIVPTLFDLGGLLDNVKALVKVGVEKNDVPRIHLACDALDAVAGELGDLQAEIYELSARLRQAVSADSEAGENLSLNELLDLTAEASDIPEEVADIVVRVGELSKAVKAAL